jgi:hypothetical protein
MGQCHAGFFQHLPEMAPPLRLEGPARERIEGAGHSVFPCGNQKAHDSFFAERLGGLQPVQTLNQHKARAVRPHQDRRPLAIVEHAGRDFVHALLFEGGAPFYRHVFIGT